LPPQATDRLTSTMPRRQQHAHPTAAAIHR